MKVSIVGVLHPIQGVPMKVRVKFIQDNVKLIEKSSQLWTLEDESLGKKMII